MLNEKAFMDGLTGREKAVFWKLRHGKQVKIETLYEMFAIDGKTKTPKERQQIVGSTISRVNKKLGIAKTKHIIRPGEARRTYKLYDIADAIVRG